MKRTLMVTLAAFAMASAAFAQSEAKDSIWAAKQAEKAKKAQDAADMKAFKAKQKAEMNDFKSKQTADFAAFVEAQKTGVKPAANTELKVEKPVLANAGDSLAYLLGVMQSNGLMPYATNQLGVDPAYVARFAQGILDRAATNPEDKELAAYNAGGQIGTQVMQMTQQFAKEYYAAEPEKTISPAIVANGIVAALLGQTDIKPDSANTVFQNQMTARREANNEALYGANREAGKKFLEENKTKEGVVTTASGLQYKVITMGTGEKPTASQKVNVDYEGKLIDGTVFDSSYQRGKPATFQANQVIKGWTEALQLMPVGSKWELYIPYELAYGDRETGGQIKPYSTLIFTVELHGIEK